ncbi:MAG: amidoligase family protein, partial [Alloprevotella sp.]|nr:amidoligase family protein [Alloprevotella sp.]
ADVRDVMNNDRYHSVNPIAYSAHGTIEFRQHQGTTNFTKIKNWVSFLAKLVAYSTENVIENEITSIDEIPFLTATEKRYFNSRKAAFEGNREREVA